MILLQQREKESERARERERESERERERATSVCGLKLQEYAATPTARAAVHATSTRGARLANLVLVH